MSKRTIFGLFLVLVASGCSLLDSDESRLSLQAYLPPPLEVSMLQVTVSDGSGRWTFDGDDFEKLSATQFNGPEFETSNHGALTVAYTLTAPDQRVISSGSVDLPIKPDWSYGVGIHADTSDPVRTCFGCSGSRAFALHPAFGSERADSIYVVWGGNSIKNPVVY